MRVGCPKEITNHEYRVRLKPESAGELVGQKIYRDKDGNPL